LEAGVNDGVVIATGDPTGAALGAARGAAGETGDNVWGVALGAGPEEVGGG
jgi:hypothetical protein